MNFCCDKFEKEYKELSTSENHICIVEHKRDGEKKRHFYLRIWNERNAFVPIKYCPYCGERLSKFYADDCYINTEMDDVCNIVRTSPSTYDSEVTKKKESNGAKVRRKYGLEVCCSELEYLCDQPKVNDLVKFIITRHILEKSMSHHYTIDKGGVERNYLKPISALSFGLLYTQRDPKQDPEDVIKDIEIRIGGWNFCPYCGKNLYTFYDNPKYANYIEGKDFAFPSPEEKLITGDNSTAITLLSLPLVLTYLIHCFSVEEMFIGWFSVIPYFFIFFAAIYLVYRYIIFTKNRWAHSTWKRFWNCSVFYAILFSSFLSYYSYVMFDILNTSIPTENKPYTIGATIEKINISENDSGGKEANVIFKFDNADNNYSKRLNDTEFSKHIFEGEIDNYSVGERYNITFKDGYFGIPKLEGMKRIK